MEEVSVTPFENSLITVADLFDRFGHISTLSSGYLISFRGMTGAMIDSLVELLGSMGIDSYGTTLGEDHIWVLFLKPNSRAKFAELIASRLKNSSKKSLLILVSLMSD